MSQSLRDRSVLEIGDSTKLEIPLPSYFSPLSRSLLICPVIAGENVIGILGFGSDTPYKFPPETVQLMTAITSTIGVLMENSRLQQEQIAGNEKLVRLAKALEFTDDAIVLVDAEGRQEYVNRAAQEIADGLSNYSPESCGSTDSISGLDAAWSGEIRRVDRNGTHVDISISTNPVTDDENRPMGRITIGRDVTENRRLQLDLVQLNHEREVEANIGRIVSSSLDIADVVKQFSEELAKIISFDGLAITGVDRETETFTALFSYLDSNSANLFKVGDSSRETVSNEVVKAGQSLFFNAGDKNIPNQLRGRMEKPHTSGRKSYLGVPLISQDQIIGALAFGRVGEGFTEIDQAKAIRIGSLISGTLAGHIFQHAKQKAEAEAQEQEARFRQIAENVTGGFWLSDLNPHRVLYASPNVEAVTGVPPESFYQGNAPWLDRVHPEDRERVEKSRELSHQTGEFYEEFRLVLDDGTIRWVSNRAFPIHDESGKLYRMGGFVEDITARKESDLRLSESQRLASIGELSAGVAHEINNPLTSITLYSQMLLDEEISDSTRNGLLVISSQAYRAAKIVRNLLQFARKSDPEKRPLSIDGLIRRSLEMKSHEFNVSGISVVDKIPEGLPLIMMDEHLILQVLLNVLTNAEQACIAANGKGTITVSAATVGEMVDITIHDDGPGIPDDQISKVFQPFFTTKETGFGTGLGLSVSHGILSQHEGSIWAESTPESGTTFHIEMPLTQRDGAALADKAAQMAPVSSPDTSTKHVLVVDDEADLRLVLSRQLELRRYNVDQAGDGEEAWRKLQNFDYHCILLDLRMPGLDGQGFYERIKTVNPDLLERIVIITGDTVNPATRNFLDSIPNPVLSKPFDFRELEQLVVSVIDQQPSVSSQEGPDLASAMSSGS